MNLSLSIKSFIILYKSFHNFRNSIFQRNIKDKVKEIYAEESFHIVENPIRKTMTKNLEEN